MKHFTLDSHMTAAIGGAFYPRGYTMVMFPSAEDANRIGHQLIESGAMSGDDIYLIPPQTVLSEIVPTVSEADSPLPSAGTDGATVRAYAKLAREGHAALLVRTKDDNATEQLMKEVRTVPYSIAQRYHWLAIEDL